MRVWEMGVGNVQTGALERCFLPRAAAISAGMSTAGPGVGAGSLRMAAIGPGTQRSQHATNSVLFFPSAGVIRDLRAVCTGAAAVRPVLPDAQVSSQDTVAE